MSSLSKTLKNSCSINMKYCHQIRSQTWNIILRLGLRHNFAHATTAKLLWHVQNCELTCLLESKLEWKGFSQDLNYKLLNCLWNGSLVGVLTGNGHVLQWNSLILEMQSTFNILAQLKTAVSPLLMHWRYHSLVLSHQYISHLSLSHSQQIPHSSHS